MANGNPKLAEVLGRRGEPEEILHALVDGGVLIVGSPDGSVLVGQLEDETVALAAFTGPEGCTGLSGGQELRHADAALLLEIARGGGIDAIVVDPESDDAALIPFGDVVDFMLTEGMAVGGEVEVAFRASEHELVPHLRTGIGGRLPDYPAVERVWISDVRLPGGVEGIMLHVVIADGADPRLADDLLQSTMEHLPASDVPVFSHVADQETEDFLAEIEAVVVGR